MQPTLAPAINAATARVLDRVGISLMQRRRAAAAAARCRTTSTPQDDARRSRRRNIDAWWPHVERGCEAIVVTASGCGVHGQGLRPPAARRPAYAAKADARSPRWRRTPVEVVAAEWPQIAPRIAMDRGAAEGRLPAAVHAAARA